MHRLLFILSFTVLFSSNAFANTQITVQAGPAMVNWITDRYSSQATLEVTYRGYLADCQSPEARHQPIVAHMIFHDEDETKIFRQAVSVNCEPNFMSREVNIAFYRISEFEPSHRNLWLLLERSRFGNVVFQLAFERAGRWDSDYGQNFEVRFGRR